MLKKSLLVIASALAILAAGLVAPATAQAGQFTVSPAPGVIAWSSDGAYVYFSPNVQTYGFGNIERLEVATGIVTHVVTMTDPSGCHAHASALAITPDDSTLLVGGYSCVLTVPLSNPSAYTSTYTGADWARRIAVGSTSAYVVFASAGRVYKIAKSGSTWGPSWTLRASASGVSGDWAALTPDEATLYVARQNNPVRVINTATGAETALANSGPSQAVAMAPDGSYLMVTDGARTVKKIIVTGASAGTVTSASYASESGMKSMVIDPTGTYIYVGCIYSRTLVKIRTSDLSVASTFNFTTAYPTLSADTPTDLAASPNASRTNAADELMVSSSALGLIISFPDVPTAPTGLSATPGDGSATISFTPATTQSAAITNYQYRLNGAGSWTSLSPADTTSPVTVTGLPNAAAVGIELRAITADGSGAASASITVTPQSTPGVPQNVVVTPGNGQLTVAFTAPASDGGSAITNYEVTTNGGTSWTAQSPSVTSSPITLTGLTNGTSYQVAIRAVNSLGSGVASGAITAAPRTTATAPRSVSATAGDGQIAISFTDPLSDGGAAITNYEVSTDGGNVWVAQSPSVTTSPITVTGLTNGTAYSVRLRAVNAAGSGTSSTQLSVTPESTPGTPQSVSVTAGSEQVTISFSAPVSNGGHAITNYEVSTNGGSSWVAQSPPVISGPITVTGLTNGTTYQVSVRAVNSLGGGTASAALSATPRSTPSVPRNVTASAGNTQVTLTFTAPASDGGSAITNYEVSTNGGSSWVAQSPTVTSGPITVTGLTNGTAYLVAVRAVNALGVGTASTAVSVTPRTTPSVPQGVSVTYADAQVTLTFTAPASDGGSAITNYEVSTNGGSSWVAQSPPVISGPITVTGLTNGTAYQVAIRAVTDAGSGTASTPLAVTPQSTPRVPQQVSVAASDGQLVISFSPPSSDGGFAISNYEVSLNGGTSWTAQNPAVTAGPITLTGLTNGTSYHVSVRAVNSLGSGAASVSISATPGTPSSGGGYTAPLVVGTVTTTGSTTGQQGSIPAAVQVPGLVPAGQAWEITDGHVTKLPLIATGRTEWKVQGSNYGVAFTSGSASPSGSARVTTTAGGRVRINGFGFTPGETVAGFLPTTRLRSTTDALALGTSVVKADGTFEVDVTVPSSLKSGEYALQVNGFASSGQSRSVNVPLEVLPATRTRTAVPSLTLNLSGGSSALAERSARAIAAFVKKSGRSAGSAFIVPKVKTTATAANVAWARAQASLVKAALVTHGFTRPIQISSSVKRASSLPGLAQARIWFPRYGGSGGGFSA